MPLTHKTKSMLRICTIGITSSAAVATSIIGATIGIQGGNFWPWAFVSFAVYAVEITYASVAAIRYTRQPEHQRQREFYKQRRERQASR